MLQKVCRFYRTIGVHIGFRTIEMKICRILLYFSSLSAISVQNLNAGTFVSALLSLTTILKPISKRMKSSTYSLQLKYKHNDSGHSFQYFKRRHRLILAFKFAEKEQKKLTTTPYVTKSNVTLYLDLVHHDQRQNKSKTWQYLTQILDNIW